MKRIKRIAQIGGKRARENAIRPKPTWQACAIGAADRVSNKLTLCYHFYFFGLIFNFAPDLGEMLERLNRPVSKTGIGVTLSRVRIPLSPHECSAHKRGFFVFRTADSTDFADCR